MAQVRVEYTPGQPKLKGHIKQIIEYNYINPRNIDSLKNPIKTIKNFDEKGDQLDEITYNKLGNLESKTVFDNSKDNTVIHSLYDSKGNLTFKTISKYDNHGLEIESGSYSDETVPSVPDYAKFKIIYKYDDKDNVIETDTYSEGNKLSAKETFIYNENHQIIEDRLTDYLPNGVSKTTHFLQYDLDGNRITSKRYLSNGDLKIEDISLYSNLDLQGNWLTLTDENKVYGTAGRPMLIMTITKREITYFQ